MTREFKLHMPATTIPGELHQKYSYVYSCGASELKQDASDKKADIALCALTQPQKLNSVARGILSANIHSIAPISFSKHRDREITKIPRERDALPR